MVGSGTCVVMQVEGPCLFLPGNQLGFTLLGYKATSSQAAGVDVGGGLEGLACKLEQMKSRMSLCIYSSKARSLVMHLAPK